MSLRVGDRVRIHSREDLARLANRVLSREAANDDILTFDKLWFTKYMRGSCNEEAVVSAVGENEGYTTYLLDFDNPKVITGYTYNDKMFFVCRANDLQLTKQANNKEFNEELI